MEKLIITTALTGNVPTKKMNPSLPVTPDEIARDVRRCADAGSALFHVHARDAEEKPSLDAEIFKDIVRHIKKTAPEVIIQLSTGARAGKDWEDRAFPVRLLPEMGSFTTGSNNLPGIIYENSPQFIEFLAKVFGETGVKPEIEVFETGMINNAVFLQKKGILQGPLHFDFVLGAPGSMPGSVKNLLFLTESIPADATWTVAGIGRHEIPLATAAILLGGHVRVGIEDNLTLPDGSPASNVTLVETIVRIAGELGREIATPEEAREILGLPAENKDRILKMV
ncbi:MAG TPA: 3-keto-5-aminohexanoate cleavage protein [Desulfobacteraceae bacterium]|nr:3-keto-5-aminohexanoate cleavage protein [Desulfobacteraceae bacterium]